MTHCVHVVCDTCGKDCCLGENAIGVSDENGNNTGLSRCDECAGVKRDELGHAWLPGETVKPAERYGETWYRPEGL